MKASLYTPWRHTVGVEVSLRSFYTSWNGDEWSASCPSHLTLSEIGTGGLWKGGSVGPRSSLDTCLHQNWNPKSSCSSLVTPAPHTHLTSSVIETNSHNILGKAIFYRCPETEDRNAMMVLEASLSLPSTSFPSSPYQLCQKTQGACHYWRYGYQFWCAYRYRD